jgi:hypothetical protein
MRQIWVQHRAVLRLDQDLHRPTNLRRHRGPLDLRGHHHRNRNRPLPAGPTPGRSGPRSNRRHPILAMRTPSRDLAAADVAADALHDHRGTRATPYGAIRLTPAEANQVCLTEPPRAQAIFVLVVRAALASLSSLLAAIWEQTRADTQAMHTASTGAGASPQSRDRSA